MERYNNYEQRGLGHKETAKVCVCTNRVVRYKM